MPGSDSPRAAVDHCDGRNCTEVIYISWFYVAGEKRDGAVGSCRRPASTALCVAAAVDLSEIDVMHASHSVVSTPANADDFVSTSALRWKAELGLFVFLCSRSEWFRSYLTGRTQVAKLIQYHSRQVCHKARVLVRHNLSHTPNVQPISFPYTHTSCLPMTHSPTVTVQYLRFLH